MTDDITRIVVIGSVGKQMIFFPEEKVLDAEDGKTERHNFIKEIGGVGFNVAFAARKAALLNGNEHLEVTLFSRLGDLNNNSNRNYVEREVAHYSGITLIDTATGNDGIKTSEFNININKRGERQIDILGRGISTTYNNHSIEKTCEDFMLSQKAKDDIDTAIKKSNLVVLTSRCVAECLAAVESAKKYNVPIALDLNMDVAEFSKHPEMESIIQASTYIWVPKETVITNHMTGENPLKLLATLSNMGVSNISISGGTENVSIHEDSSIDYFLPPKTNGAFGTGQCDATGCGDTRTGASAYYLASKKNNKSFIGATIRGTILSSISFAFTGRTWDKPEAIQPIYDFMNDYIAQHDSMKAKNNANVRKHDYPSL